LTHESKVVKPGSLPPGVETVAEMLRAIGYRTAAVICNYVLRNGTGFEQGFEIYDDTMHEHEAVRELPERVATVATDRALALLDELQDERFFMWIHYQDPHGPYTPPGRYTEMFVDPTVKPRRLKINATQSGKKGIPSYQELGDRRDYHYYVSQYDGEIRYWDEQFNRLIEGLKRLELYDETLIVFSADHGEGMGEQQLFFAHGENLHNSLTRVPLIIRYGDRLHGRRAEYTQHLDIVPTIRAALNLPPDERL
jgi:arylsulfatase